MKFLVIICTAVLVEAFTEYLKTAFPKISQSTGILFLITSAIGILLAFTIGANIFESLGIVSNIPFVGEILTGILCGRGSNYIYDLMEKLTSVPKTDEPQPMQEDSIG